MTNKRGEYSVELQKKGINEICGKKLKNGQIYYTIWLGNGEGIDTLNQETAIMMSAIIRIEDKVNKLLKEQK